MSPSIATSPPPGPAIAVLSAFSIVVPNETTKSLEEMIFEASTQALTDAGMTSVDLGGIVLSGNDQVDGRVISIMPSAGPAAGVNRDTTMIASSGDHALPYGYLRLKSGQGKNVLVVGWSKPSESVDPDRAELMAAEPYLLRPIGMNMTIAAALQASLWVSDTDEIDSSDTVAWPLGRKDLPARGDSVHAAVLAIEGEFPEGSELAWIVDTGWATTSYELGQRNLGELDALTLAAAQVTKRSPAADATNWDAVEIAADSEFAVKAVLRTLPIREDAVINASGSLSAVLTAPHVAGLGRMMAAIHSVKSAGATTTGAPRITAGIGFNGFAGQGATVMVFSSSKGAQA